MNSNPGIEILACDCADCKHWQVVKLTDDNGVRSYHLHCKTCDRKDELDSFTVHEQPGSQMKWIAVEKE